MAHLSKLSPAAFSGSPSIWANNLAAQAANELVKTGNRNPFVFRHPVTRKPCLVIPTITPRHISFGVVYSILPAALNAECLTAEEVAKNWRRYGRGYVLAEFNPELRVIDHDGSIRATLGLLYATARRAPSPREADEVFHARLAERVERDAARVRRIVHAI